MSQQIQPYFKIVLDTRAPLSAKEKEVAEVHMLVGDVSALMADEVLRAEALQKLSPQRQEKAKAINHARGQAQTIGATLILDALLAEVGLQERNMRYVIGEHGKPRFQANDIAFSLSHSGSLAAAALIGMKNEESRCTRRSARRDAPHLENEEIKLPTSLKSNSYSSSFILHSSLKNNSSFYPFSVGLDIQRITHYRPELVRRVFSAADRQLLAAAATEAERQRLFTRLWCRAEAYAKATGEGLHWPFPTPPLTARFHDFEVGEGYCGCLCTDDNVF